MGSDNVEEEALRRLTMLRVQMLQERVRAEQQGSEQQQHHAMYTQMQHLQQEQMQQQAQAQAHARAQQEQLQRVLETAQRVPYLSLLLKYCSPCGRPNCS